MKFKRLLAKSWPNEEKWQGAATYVGHISAVMRAADVLLEKLTPLILKRLNLQVKPECFKNTVKLGAYLHDWGKANKHFQIMIRLKDLEKCRDEEAKRQQQIFKKEWRSINERQMIRHEILSGILALKIDSNRSWLEKCPDADFMVAIWAGMGHHLKIGEKKGQDSYKITEIPDGTGRELLVYSDHPNFTALLEMGVKYLGLPESIPIQTKTIWTKNELLEAINELSEQFANLAEKIDKDSDYQRFIAAVKATVIAADIAGSGLPSVTNKLEDWMREVLDLVLTPDEIQSLIDQRLNGKKPRDFQEKIANTDSRVTLVRAGCGTGKTVAAYMWGKKNAVGHRLFFAYPTTGTASQGYLDYAAETDIETKLMHSRAEIDLEGVLFSGEGKHDQNPDDDDAEQIDARLASFSTWQAKLIVCTVDSVLGLMHNNRKPLYAWPAICQSAFVFDEVHAYDKKLFGALLRFLKTFRDVPILLMSASFSEGQIQAIRQVMDKLGKTLNVIPGTEELKELKDLEELERYNLHSISDFTEAWQQVEVSFKQPDKKNKVLWVTNTVDSCIEIYQEAVRRFQPLGIRVLIYHSRFRYQERVKKHEKVIKAFNANEPVIAITTQVCEMSLDISANLLISALAPAAALIQRLGRLNRRKKNKNEENCPAFIYEWTEKYPYKGEELETGRKLLDLLLNQTISQKDLADVMEKLDFTTFEDVRCNWLDGRWRSHPDALREAGHTITVLLEQDLKEIAEASKANNKSFAKEAQRWTVPIPIVKDYTQWERKGVYPIAPKDKVIYSSEIGARLMKDVPKIILHLGNPGITLMHRAGIAGLCMTLKQLEKQYPDVRKRKGNLSWLLNARSVELFWQGNDQEVLDWLLKESFQISEEGLITFTGLNPKEMDFPTQIMIHQGMRGTFLQHPSTFKSAGNESRNLQIEEDSPAIIVKYQKAESYAHQTFAKNLCDEKGNLLKEYISIAGWLNPGAVVRHIAFSSQTGFEETPEQAFALLFAPVACQFFLLRSKLRDQRAQFALVIPEIIDLELYAKHKPKLGYENFCASNLGDAGLRFLTHQTTLNLARANKLKRCQVITLGTVAWSSQQKTRTDLEIVEVKNENFHNYQLSCDYFTDKTIQGKEGGFRVPSFAREIIAENLARGLPWWSNFSTIINNGELFQRISYEKEGLFKMVQNAQWDETNQILFVEACHEALKKTYAKIYGRIQEGEYAQINRENERIRTSLGRCKNTESFRQFITDFWSRAGQISILQEPKQFKAILSLITDEKKWKMARDLTLLALISYKKSDKEDSNQEFD